MLVFSVFVTIAIAVAVLVLVDDKACVGIAVTLQELSHAVLDGVDTVFVVLTIWDTTRQARAASVTSMIGGVSTMMRS